MLHLLLDDIAHHFLEADAEAAQWLQWCMNAEDQLLAQEHLPSDFVCAVYAKA